MPIFLDDIKFLNLQRLEIAIIIYELNIQSLGFLDRSLSLQFSTFLNEMAVI